MKNITTKEFCEKFSFRKENSDFMQKFDTMKSFYQFLLSVDKNEIEHPACWMIDLLSINDVVEKRTRVGFGSFCANRVRPMMTNEHCERLLDIAIAYGKGESTEDDFNKIKSEKINPLDTLYFADFSAQFSDYPIWASSYAIRSYQPIFWSDFRIYSAVISNELYAWLIELRRIGNIFED